jgi:drug/metabolite transporter (DMT)-like permease
MYREGAIKGYVYILAGSTLWGVSSVVAKSLFNIGLPPAELILVRLTISTLYFFCSSLFPDT